MSKLAFEICIGLGDNLVIRIYFDTVKHLYDEIRISHSKEVVSIYRDNDPAYYKFLDDIGTLLFSEPPYIFTHDKYPPIQRVHEIMTRARVPKKPNLDKCLCVGQSLNLEQEYIVLTTKVRCLSKTEFGSISSRLWAAIKRLSQKYKIVILGEREVEESKEYVGQKDTIFSIYESIISNLGKECLIDLTVPALGITTPELPKLQQDFLIMKEAKVNIAIGIGGNFWMSAAVGNTICYRVDDDTTIDLVSNPEFPTMFATKNFQDFLNKLESYNG